jgi:hypothetical protein
MRLTGRGSLDLALCDFLLLLVIGRRFTSFSGVPMGARSHGGHRMGRAWARARLSLPLFLSLGPPGRVCRSQSASPRSPTQHYPGHGKYRRPRAWTAVLVEIEVPASLGNTTKT